MRTILLFILLLFFQHTYAQLQQISGFGTNPGNLNMYLYAPSNMPASAPVVIAMHGCTQTANQFATETGWNTLANQHKFYVIYPEQLSSNNSSRCFNWFESGDITRGQGECRSIKSMLEYLAANYSIDASRVFVTGFSAGGGMTTVMLATYPEVFKGGAVMAGLPYKAGIGSTAAFSAMSPGVNKTPQEWGNLVRSQNSTYTGPWPSVAVFHGTSDFTVKNMNLTEVMEQWTNVHGTDASADLTQSSFNGNGNITRKDYHNTSGTPVVVTYDITSMGHVVAIDPGTGSTQGGTTGSYSSDVNFYSCYWAGEFWNLFGSTPPPSIAAPSGLSATAQSSSSIALSWTDNANNEQNFQVERSTSSGSGFSVIATLGANSNSYTDNGLNASTTYYYRVQASSGSTASAYSNTANATTAAAAGTAPAAPTGLVLQNRTSSSISMSWVDNSGNEDNFELQRSLSSGTGFSTIATLAANTITYTDNGLSPNTAYFYRVRATNINGTSTYSNELSTTTLPTSTTTIIQQNTQQAYISVNNLFNSGQSFTATVTGVLSKIDVNLRQAVSNSTLRIYSGNTVSGTALYQQTGISVGSGWQSITLSNTFNLTANQQYTFVLTGSSFGYALSNAYSGGHLWYNGFAYSLYDAAFRVYQESSGALMQAELARQQSPGFLVFPNPSRGKFTVSGPEGLAFPLHLRLFDATGRLVKMELMLGPIQEFDCTEVKPGLYWMSFGKGKVQAVVLE